MRLFKGVEFTYEEMNGSEVTLQVDYDIEGTIDRVYVGSQFGGLMLVDLDWMQKHKPSRYFYIQEKVNEALQSDGYNLEAK